MSNEQSPYARASAAIRSGDIEGLEELFRHFPELLDTRIPSFGTWLHYAAGHGTPELVEFLIRQGMDVNSADGADGSTPLRNAAAKGRADIADQLLKRGARIDVSDSVRNPLFAAIIGNASEVARLLLDKGIDTSPRYTSSRFKGMHALAFALMWGRVEIARMIALRDAKGDEAAADLAIAEADQVAEAHTSVPE